MSPVAKFSILALASTVLAVPYHGHQHAHFHSPQGSGSSVSGAGSPRFTYSPSNATKPHLGSTGTGFRSSSSAIPAGPGGYGAQTKYTTITVNAAGESTSVAVAAGYVSSGAADTEDCTDEVTVTSTQKTTVYVTATASYGSDVSAVVEETTTSGGKTITLKSTVFRTVHSTVYATPSAPVSAVSSIPAYSSKPSSSIVASGTGSGSAIVSPVTQSSAVVSSVVSSPVSTSTKATSTLVSSSVSSSSSSSSPSSSPSSSSSASTSKSSSSSFSSSASSTVSTSATSTSSSSPAAPPAYTPPSSSSSVEVAPTTTASSTSSAAPTTSSSSSTPTWTPPAYTPPSSSSTKAAPTTTSTSSTAAPPPAYTTPTVAASSASSSAAPSTSKQQAANAVSTGSAGTGKRGLAYNDASLTSAFAGSSHISWAYNWGSSTSGLASGLNYIPLLWGLADEFSGSWLTHAKSAISSGSTHLFSFNEPDLSSQSNLSPAAAAAAWKLFMEPLAGSAKMCAPSVTNGGGSMGLTWLSNFLSACSGCTIDCVNIHWYDSAENVDYFKAHVTNATQIANGRPVFISEFGASGSDSQISTFLESVMPWMDSNDAIAGYAYFMVSQGKLVNGNSPSDYGSTYMSYSG